MDDKTGILLLNLGTPDDTSIKSVKRYLRQFLNDPRVIDIPFLWRWILVNLIIVPFRASATAKAYKSIWQESGSPLLHNSNLLKAALNQALDKGVFNICEDSSTGATKQDAAEVDFSRKYIVALGMRYGNPSISDAIEKLLSSGVNYIKIVPLFPHYASASSGSAIEETLRQFTKKQVILPFEVLPSFYNHKLFIQVWSERIKKHCEQHNIEHVIFSFHGLPERHLLKLENTSCCDMVDECPMISAKNESCYRAQCYESARLIAKSIKLDQKNYTVSFQSRLGKTPWIQPYLNDVLPIVKRQGANRVAVASLSFVADCLETLEEIAITTQEKWLCVGGEHLSLVPSLNDDPGWVEALKDMVTNPFGYSRGG